MAGQAGAHRDRDREVRLAGPGRAEQQHVFAAGEEVELAEVQNDRLLDALREAEVELLECLSGREARSADTTLATVCLAAGGLGGEQCFGEALVAPLLAARPLSEPWQRACDRWGFQRAAEKHHLGGELAHAGINAS